MRASGTRPPALLAGFLFAKFVLANIEPLSTAPLRGEVTLHPLGRPAHDVVLSFRTNAARKHAGNGEAKAMILCPPL
jgi:hypothetical protein